MITRQKAMRLGVVLGLAWVVGCGGPGTAPTVKVTGTVTYNGEPVDGVNVGFIPDGEGARPASGTTDASGKFSLSTFKSGDGATLGKHTVVITEPTDSTTTDDYSLPDESARRFPAKYENSRTSGLSATVEKGKENDFSFDMTD
ncbi:MAG TPA: hypothetical protein VMY37_29605 [Thermoguttaceae bacterium]|nr:hypothetical protein [Thermoguttaceae bacterium]HUU82697.1 hypothetical protein [Phycisphaerae bacterium]